MSARSSELLKEGTRHLQGVDEAVIRNIEAIRDLAKIVRTSLGPQGMNKMVINHLEKLFVTNDAATILKELDVFHPAAKLAVMASQRQESEIGDATNLVLVLVGELLNQAESLIRNGLHPNDIISGYEKAYKKGVALLEDLVAFKVDDVKNAELITKAVRSSVSSKQFGYADLMAPVIAKACTMVSSEGKFNVDDVRVAKIPGGSVTDMDVVKGVVIVRAAEGTIKHVQNAKVGVFSSGIDYAAAETKETFVVNKASQLEGFAASQEDAMEKIIKEIADSGVTVIVSGNKIGDMAMHFIEKYKMMAVKVTSKFELRRVCRTCGATPLLRLGAPTAEEIGTCDIVSVDEIGGTKVTVFKQLESTKSKISTIVCRGATDNILDDLERSIEDGVNTYKQLTVDPRFVAGAGASEIELARLLRSYGDATPGQDQYAIRKFAEALEIVPRTLAENGGHDATSVIAKLYAAHQAEGKQNYGVDVESGEVRDAVEAGVLDLFSAKANALYLATNTAIDILRVDQLVMAKPAVGPKVPPPQSQDAGGPEF